MMKSVQYCINVTKSLPTGVSTFASPASPSTDQSLQKSFHLLHPRENFKLFSPTPKKIKNATHNTTQTDKKNKWTMILKLNTDNSLQRRADRTPAANRVLPQLAVKCKIEAKCSYQTFVQVDREVLLNRQLR